MQSRRRRATVRRNCFGHAITVLSTSCRKAGWEGRAADYSPLFGSFLTAYNRAGLDAQSTYLFQNGAVTARYEFELENGPTEGRHNQAAYLEVRYQFGRRD